MGVVSVWGFARHETMITVSTTQTRAQMTAGPTSQADRDLALMARVADGDPKAQEQVALRLAPHVRAVARALLGSSPDADDAVQNSLMRVLEAADRYRGIGTLEGWARVVTVRICLRASRRRRRMQVVESGGAELTDLPEATPAPLLGEAVPRPLEEYLEALPFVQREAVVLHHVLDYSVREIAELIETPTDTVKSRLAYGLKALRRSIRRDLSFGHRRTDRS